MNGNGETSLRLYDCAWRLHDMGPLSALKALCNWSMIRKVLLSLLVAGTVCWTVYVCFGDSISAKRMGFRPCTVITSKSKERAVNGHEVKPTRSLPFTVKNFEAMCVNNLLSILVVWNQQFAFAWHHTKDFVGNKHGDLHGVKFFFYVCTFSGWRRCYIYSALFLIPHRFWRKHYT